MSNLDLVMPDLRRSQNDREGKAARAKEGKEKEAREGEVVAKERAVAG